MLRRREEVERKYRKRIEDGKMKGNKKGQFILFLIRCPPPTKGEAVHEAALSWKKKESRRIVHLAAVRTRAP